MLKEGINIQLVCSSSDCDSNKEAKYGDNDKTKRVLLHYGKLFFASVYTYQMKCPVCDEKIKLKNITCVWMCRCSYSIEGNLITDDQKTKEYNIKGSTTKKNNIVKLFHDKKLVYWAGLMIEVKDLL